MRGLVRIVACVALAAGLAGAPAASADGNFVLVGSTSGYVDVVVPGDRELDLYSTVGVETTGRFGGFFAEQLRSNRSPDYVGRQAGAVVLRDVRSDRSQPHPERVGGLTPLSGGVIRFYLIADGPTKVGIYPAAGLPVRTFRPVRRTAAAATVTPLAPVGDTLAATASVRLPQRSLVVSALRAEGTGAALLPHARFCVVPRGPEACPEMPFTRLATRWASSSTANPSRYWVVAYHPGAFRSGQHLAHYAVTPLSNVAPVTRAAGVRFVLTLA